MSIFSDIGDFISKNADWLKPAASLGSNLFKYNQSSGNQNSYIDLLKSMEDKRYADTKAYNEAANAYNAQAMAVGNANSAAARAASAANQAAALAAQNKATKQMDKVYKRNLSYYKPFFDTSQSLLPQMTKAYTGSLDGYNMLAAYLTKPENLAKLNYNNPQWATGAPVPTWAKK